MLTWETIWYNFRKFTFIVFVWKIVFSAFFKGPLKITLTLDGNRAYVHSFMCLFSLLFCFLFCPPILTLTRTLSLLHLPLFLHHSNYFPALSSLFVLVPFLRPFSAVSLSVLYPLHLLLSQITVNVAQGRVQSPSPQPRYKSYAYTQAAYVKSPEQKRRRFTDQVRVSQS